MLCYYTSICRPNSIGQAQQPRGRHQRMLVIHRQAHVVVRATTATSSVLNLADLALQPPANPDLLAYLSNAITTSGPFVYDPGFLDAPAASVTGLTPSAIATWLTMHQLQAWSLEVAAAGLATLVLAAVHQRPRGWVRSDLVESRQSSVAGRGLFVKVRVASGTVLGSYPGRPRSPAEMAWKLQYAPMAKQYIFQTDHGVYLDPTDETGQPSAEPAPGLPYWPLSQEYDEALAYANEPPVGGSSTNCTVCDGSSPLELLFVTTCDLEAASEVFIDYGTAYDRSQYHS